MRIGERTSSHQVPNQLRAVTRDDAPRFVDFVTAYFAWLESETAEVTVSMSVGSDDFAVWDRVLTADGRGGRVLEVDGDSAFVALDTDSGPLEAGDTLTAGDRTGVVVTVERTRQAGWDVRRFLENRDVDSGVDEFVDRLKREYLFGIQYDTVVPAATIIKHSLDLYRSRGTERSIDLLFREVFGRPATVYLPGRDVLRASPGGWVRPAYLELSNEDDRAAWVAIAIEGIESGARAFVERWVRKRVRGRTVNLAYIGSVSGSFVTGERIRRVSDGVVGPAVLGSLTELAVTDGGSGFVRGDVVDVESSAYGVGARAVVTSVESVSGLVEYSLGDGGWGYTSNATALVSDQVLTVSGSMGGGGTRGWEYFDTLTQPLANVAHTGATATLAVGQALAAINSTAGIGGLGRVLSVSGNTAMVAVLSGNLESNATLAFWDWYELATESDYWLLQETGEPLLSNEPVGTLTVSAYTDETRTANVMGVSTNATVTVSVDDLSQYADVDEVYQGNSSASVATVSYSGSTAVLRLTGLRGSFANSAALLARRSDGSSVAGNGLVIGVSTTIGVRLGGGDDVLDLDYNFFHATSGAHGTVTRAVRSNQSSFSVGPSRDFVETVELIDEPLSPYAAIDLDAVDYGMPGPGAEDTTSVIETSLSPSTGDVGSIVTVVTTNPGTGAVVAPFATVYDPFLYPYDLRDRVLSHAAPTVPFAADETVTLGGIDVGTVLQSNTTETVMRRRRWATVGTGDTIVGADSGASVTVTAASDARWRDRAGISALVLPELVASNGAVAELRVLDSGYGFSNGETVTFSGNSSSGEARVALGRMGQDRIGFSVTNDGLLSSDKYLRDGYYYQEFSYVVRAPVAFEAYSDMLRATLHVAGTRMFGEFELESVLDASPDVPGVEIGII